MTWQGLYATANRLARRLAPHAQGKPAEGEILVIEPCEMVPRRKKDPEPGDDTAAVDEDGLIEIDDDRDPIVLAGEGHLVQGLLDTMLRQSQILNSYAGAEPEAGTKDASNLDKALALAEKHLDALTAVIDSRGSKAGQRIPSSGKAVTPPWVEARESMRKKIETAQKEAPIKQAEAERELKEVEEALKQTEKDLAEAQAEVAKVEREYSVARIEAEGCNLAEAQIAKLQNQAKSGKERKKQLEEELEKEQALVAEKEKATQDTRQRCRELQQQIVEAERRLQKRYNSQIPVEDVVALRRTVVRQQRDIVALRRRGAAQGEVETLTDDPTASMGLTKSRKSTDMTVTGTSSEKSRANTGRKPLNEITVEQCWYDIQDIQKELLLEQARTPLIALEEPEPEQGPDDQRKRLESLAKRSCEIRGDITALLREAADPGNKKKEPAATQFASVALTRFLKETASAVERGPAAKVSIRAPAAFGKGSKTIAGLCPSVPVLADAEQLRSVHHAML